MKESQFLVRERSSVSPRRNTFSKSERLCWEKGIESLLKKGRSIYSHPLKIKWFRVPNDKDDVYCKVLLIVPKRLFKRAVDRNQKKRFLREAYRLNKHPLFDYLQEQKICIHLSISVQDKSTSSRENIEEAIIRLVHLLLLDLQRGEGNRGSK